MTTANDWTGSWAVSERIDSLLSGAKNRIAETHGAEGGTLPFAGWLPAISPSMRWDWEHIVHIRKHLERVAAGDIDRLILTVPPRHGKSELTTVRFPTWLLEEDPTRTVIIGAYSQTLANKFSRKARSIARRRIELNAERTAVDDWETAVGGGLRAAGVGAGVTGMGGQYIIIDDPVKNREEANSQTYRDKVWDWYRDDLYTRLEPSGAIVLIMTRWHEDDLAGRLLADTEGDTWTVVNLPALAEEDDPLGRSVGDALCPDRYDVPALQRIQGVLGRSFSALFQQRPTAAEGEFFQRSWFEIVGAVPAGSTFCRFWDKAGTANDGDYTAGVLMAKAPDGLFYVVDVVKGQWSSGARERMMRQTAELDRDAYGHVSIGIEQEPGSGGKDSAAASVRNLAGFSAFVERSTGDKATRAEPFQAQAEVGNVRLVRGAWIPAYLDELTSFPQGSNDDQVDGSSGAFNRLTKRLQLRSARIDPWDRSSAQQEHAPEPVRSDAEIERMLTEAGHG